MLRDSTNTLILQGTTCTYKFEPDMLPKRLQLQQESPLVLVRVKGKLFLPRPHTTHPLRHKYTTQRTTKRNQPQPQTEPATKNK